MDPTIPENRDTSFTDYQSGEYGKSGGGIKRLFDRSGISEMRKAKEEYGGNRPGDLGGIKGKY